MSGKFLEESLQRDVDRIRAKVTLMAALAKRALRDCVSAIRENNRQLAYSIILRDQRIDELEKEIDRLCLEFLVRQQPVAGPLRFVYATIKINLELERVGDYAESIARQVIKLVDRKVDMTVFRFGEMADLSIPMLRDAIRAFVEQDPDFARKTAETEVAVDALRNEVNEELFKRVQDKIVPLEGLTPLMTIARRFERVSDQAKNICEETLYMCTGQYAKHKGAEVFRILFVDEQNGPLSQMAEALGNSLQDPDFIFSSAGLHPGMVESSLTPFLEKKGLKTANVATKGIRHIPNLDDYHIVVGLANGAQRVTSEMPGKTVYLDWTPAGSIANPTADSDFEQAHQLLQGQINDLVKALSAETQN
jgi:phosphate transport system protein